MNIFASDSDPVKAAQYLDDKRVVKMVLETAQILSTVLHKLGSGSSSIYRPTHSNHPCVIWAGKSRGNFNWLVLHGLALNEEYKKRFFKIYPHKSTSVILDCAKLFQKIPIDEKCMTPFPNCTNITGNISVVKKYRLYLSQTKWSDGKARWTVTGKPSWYKG